MTKHKIQDKSKLQISNSKTFVSVFVIAILNLFCVLNFVICHLVFAQGDELEFTLDVNSATLPLPKIFKPNIDISGRGFSQDATWPQETAGKEVLETWRKDIGFNGFIRLQYNLWEISQLSKAKEAQEKLLANYENIIKSVNDAGGVVILNLFGTPQGLGRVLDKASTPRDPRAFKALIKNTIRTLSCEKKYNIWYEVWNAPDLDDFFLGRTQEYLMLYRMFAESVKELEQESKIHILLGGPSVTWWFHSPDGNTVATPEKSLIYELIRFCSHYRLPLDFITWHGFSCDPQVEKESTVYKKSAIKLVREWLTYFKLDKNTPLIVDEWNFDRDSNVLAARAEQSCIAASYIPARLKNMAEAGLDYQMYFSLEDFQNNKEGVVRNVGVFSFDQSETGDKELPKATYNCFKMLSLLESNLFPVKSEDEFSGIIATGTEETMAILLYNYIDPEVFINYLSRNISTLRVSERKILLGIIDSERLGNIMSHKSDISRLRATNRIKNLLKKGVELYDRAKKFETENRQVSLELKNLKENYIMQRYVIDASCALNSEFFPVEQKEIEGVQSHKETLQLSPYSVQLILLRKKPKEEVPPPTETVQPEAGAVNNTQSEAVKGAQENSDNASENK